MKSLLTAIFVYLLTSLPVMAGATKWLDFTLSGGHVVLPAEVSGIPTSAILDSGAQINAINAAFIGKHELDYNRVGKIRIDGAFGEKRADKLAGVPIKLFETETSFDQVVELSLGHHSKGLLLGSPLFYGNIMQIDYPAQRLRIVNREAMDLGEFQNIDIVDQRGSGMPLVKVTINGRSVWLILDTGNSGGVLIERTLAESLDLISDQNAVEGAMGATRTSYLESTRVKEVVFGPYTLENVLVSFNTEGNRLNIRNQFSKTGSRIKGKRVSGLIGYDILKHFILTMDYGRGQMHVGLPEN
ncbi:pepsin/retropepsin-like aspartic protease family protein [Alteromonas sp. ASW11-19]|uniref:Pepsin/retropepsin-like aspartic protease family protein n=1 Tax=Alteromonas salexigens TaxID=2982530 RepID=A0ABT2VRS4_9ALTE|nr:pepsin/retropepsin-like aspartic protease family protein [Alteromonas salexigens]MCU7556024.1 pepsin/retropepsin-like aspartic protease family protein [Alteromonas salexigens]